MGSGSRDSRYHIEDLLEAMPLSVAELIQAASGFECDTAGMLRASVSTAGRAFAELDACDGVIDQAATSGTTSATRLRHMLGNEAVEEIHGELRALDATIEEVRLSAQRRLLINRILGRSEDKPGPPQQVKSFALELLPALPSSYDDGEEEFSDLVAMAGREEELEPRLEEAHAERISQLAVHLVAVVERAAESGFADTEFSRESMQEARRACDLWQRCLSERQRDLG